MNTDNAHDLGDFHDDFDEYKHTCHLGNGYKGHSTSWNSIYAREDGEFPLSEWTKTKLVDAITAADPIKGQQCKQICLEALRCHFLKGAGYHHTSKWYNKTDFFALNSDAIECVTADKLSLLSTLKSPKVKTETTTGIFKYIVFVEVPWHRHHGFLYGGYTKPNIHEVNPARIEAKGQFYTVYDASGNRVVRKKIGSTGTEVILDPERSLPPDICTFLSVPEISYKAFEAEVLDSLSDRFDVSKRGIIYPKGRKPSPEAFDNGLGNFFAIGEKRVGKDCFGNYRVEKWNGGWWIDDADTEPIA